MPVKEINTEEKIANLEDKIARLQEQLSNKKTSAAKKAAQKQIKLLENKLNQLIGFNSLSIGDWVCNGQPDLPGQIIELKQEKEHYEAWVLWENEIVSKPSAPSTLTIQDPIQFTWQWNQYNSAIIRTFDYKDCDDFQALLDKIETLQSEIKKTYEESGKDRIAKQLHWIHQRWKNITKDKFRVGDRVKYEAHNATVEGYQYLASLLYVWIKFDNGDNLLVSPENLEPLGIAQQVIKVEPEETYPCVKEIAIACITREPTLQQRVRLDPATVQEYCEILSQGEKLDPVQLVLDNRGNYWLWDGFHTVEAHVKNQLTFIEARITLGSYDDAFRLSLGANAKRGLKLSRADKYNKVKNALLAELTDATGKPLSNRAIAKICCVSHTMVGEVRKQLFPPTIEPDQKQTSDLKEPEVIPANPEPIAEEKSQLLIENSPTSPSNLETHEAEEPQSLTENPQTSASQVPRVISEEEIEQAAIVSGVSSNDDDRLGNIIVYVNEDIVYVKKTSADKRLVGYLGSAAMVIENHYHSVDLLFWGENIIKNVAKEDIGLMEQKVNILARIPTKQLAILIQKFKTPEDAIAKFTDQLTANEF